MNVLKSAFKRTFGNILAKLLPAHAKRILFLVTLYHFMKEDGGKDTAELEELNRMLLLAKTDAKALVFPGIFTNMLWEGRGEELVHCDKEQIVDKIVKAAPCWLNYGRKDDVVSDVTKLQHFVSKHA